MWRRHHCKRLNTSGYRVTHDEAAGDEEREEDGLVLDRVLVGALHAVEGADGVLVVTKVLGRVQVRVVDVVPARGAPLCAAGVTSGIRLAFVCWSAESW